MVLFVGISDYVTNPPEPTADRVPQISEGASPRQRRPVRQFDRQQLQRGFQVYKEVCAACHGLKLVAFRNLAELGYSEAEVKAIAASGRSRCRRSIRTPASRRPVRRLRPTASPSPMPNEVAARAANNNAFRPTCR
jgi:ubiquinol-cytochrome c reductase cytochrome c1 subunit